MRGLLVICLLILLQACANGAAVRQDVNLATDFSRIERFAIQLPHPLERGEVSLAGLSALNVNADDIRSALAGALSGKNWLHQENREGAQVLVTLTYGMRDGLTIYRDYVRLGYRGWLWSADPRGERYTPDTLAVDVFDGITGNALWHGYARLSDFDVENQRLAFHQALISIIDAFPPDISKLRGSVRGEILVQ